MFFIIPVGVDYRTQRLPVVTFVLIGINTLIYLLSWLVFLAGGPIAEIKLVMALGLTPARVELYTLFTSLFVHTGFFHLLGNMIYLFLFGSCVEDILGRWKFVLFYLAGGLAADFVHILVALVSGAGDIPMIGASGAISACIGGFVLLLSKASINFRWVFWLIFRVWSGEFWLPAWLVISFWFFKDVFSTGISIASESADSGVAFGAHVGGFLAGLGIIGLRRLAGHKGDEKRTQPLPLPRVAAAPRRPRVVAVARADMFIYDNGTQLGPLTPGQVQAMLSDGTVSREAFYWQEGMTEWRNVEELVRE